MAQAPFIQASTLIPACPLCTILMNVVITITLPHLFEVDSCSSDNLHNYDQSTTKIHMMTISSGTFGDWVVLESKQFDSYVKFSGLKGVG